MDYYLFISRYYTTELVDSARVAQISNSFTRRFYSDNTLRYHKRVLHISTFLDINPR